VLAREKPEPVRTKFFNWLKFQLTRKEKAMKAKTNVKAGIIAILIS
jgi:hypothetical protein